MNHTKKELDQMTVEKLYKIAKKKGIRHNDSMDKDQLIQMIVGFEKEEEKGEIPDENDFSAKNPLSARKGNDPTI